MRSPAAAASAVLLLLAVSSTAHAAVSNPLTAWTDLAQTAVRSYGIQNQLSTR